VSFAAITLYVASQRVFIIVSIYFIIDSVRKILDAPSYMLYRYFLHPSSVKIFLFWDTYKLCSSLRIGGHISHPQKRLA